MSLTTFLNFEESVSQILPAIPSCTFSGTFRMWRELQRIDLLILETLQANWVVYSVLMPKLPSLGEPE